MHFPVDNPKLDVCAFTSGFYVFIANSEQNCRRQPINKYFQHPGKISLRPVPAKSPGTGADLVFMLQVEFLGWDLYILSV